MSAISPLANALIVVGILAFGCAGYLRYDALRRKRASAALRDRCYEPGRQP